MTFKILYTRRNSYLNICHKIGRSCVHKMLELMIEKCVKDKFRRPPDRRSIERKEPYLLYGSLW